MTPVDGGYQPLGSEALHRVLDVSRHLGMTADRDTILRVIIDALRDLLDAERATVFEYDAETDELFSTVAHGLADTEGEGGIRFSADRGIAGLAARSRETILIADAYADSRFNREIDRRTGFRTRSILSVPLVSFDGELIGVAQVLNRRGRSFEETDQPLAEALGAQAAVAIKRARLVEDQIARRRMERDLEVARSIQQQSFPKILPAIRGFDIACWSEPAESTGGDTYDLIPLGLQVTPWNGEGFEPLNRALLLLADATGHGIGPALLATSIRGMLRMAARLSGDLAAIIQQLNGQLCADMPPGRFITTWLGIADGERGSIESFSAGQAPLLHIGSGEPKVLDADEPPFGIDPHLADVRTTQIDLEPGDLFAVISDGIFEARRDEQEEFGVGRVVELLSRRRSETASEILEALRNEAHAFRSGEPAADDQTIIIIKRVEP